MITSNIFLTASEIGVTLKDGYNGDISAKDAHTKSRMAILLYS